MIDKRLLEILVCPKCKGALTAAEGGSALVCKTCQLKYPVRENIPVMLVDEAVSVKTSKSQSSVSKTETPVATFRIIAGPNKGLSFHLERFTCKAIGRSILDPNKTAMFDVEVSLSLDESTKGLVQNYISRQFKEAKSSTSKSTTGIFKRTGDVILDDMAISRLHSMIFFGESGVGVLDMVSKNGTFINGEEIESRLLKKGDAVEMGETKIVFEG